MGVFFWFGAYSSTVERAKLNQGFKCSTKNQVNVFHMRHDSFLLSGILFLLSLLPYLYTHTLHTLTRCKSLPYTVTSFVSILSSSVAKIWCIGLQQTAVGMASEQ